MAHLVSPSQEGLAKAMSLNELTGVHDRKTAIRDEVRGQLKAIASPVRSAASNQACQLLRQQKIWQNARAILFYAPLSDELDLSPLWKECLEQGKTVALPRFAAEQNAYVPCRVDHFKQPMARGRFGVLEPDGDSPRLPSNQLDLILVPGVAFDMSGRRVGRGRGFYDRLLRDIRGAKCGVGFDEQIRAEIPVEPHDICLNYLLTPTRWLDVSLMGL